MARVVLIVDSSSGELIDVAGNGRESGRYRKFAKRILSGDTNPTLDYGGNGGDTLSISKNGGRGAEINLLADVVNVPVSLKIAGKTVQDIASEQTSGVLDCIVGTENEITIVPIYDESSTAPDTPVGIQISLDQSVVGKLAMIEAAIGGMSNLVKKSDIATVIKDLKVESDDTLEDVKGTLRVLIERLSALAGNGSSSDSSSSSDL